jgi:hypothetical protein
MDPSPPPEPQASTRRRAIREVLAVLATGGAFLVWENVLRWPKFPFLLACTAFWGGYLFLRVRRDRTALRDWGLRRDTLAAASTACLAVLVLGTAAIVAYRLAAGWSGFPPRLWLVLALYPLWSFVQQFVVQALVSANLVRLGWARWSVVVVSALIFGAAHLPDLALSVLCLGAGLLWTAIFLWRPNLVPLALTHAWLGTLTYGWVLGRDPWQEMFPGRN